MMHAVPKSNRDLCPTTDPLDRVSPGEEVAVPS